MKTETTVLLGLAGLAGVYLLTRGTSPASSSSSSSSAASQLLQEAADREAKGDTSGAKDLRDRAAALLGDEPSIDEGGILEDWYGELKDRTGRLFDWGLDELDETASWARYSSLILPLGGGALLVWLLASDTGRELVSKFRIQVG